jgi:hypothetical protein
MACNYDALIKIKNLYTKYKKINNYIYQNSIISPHMWMRKMRPKEVKRERKRERETERRREYASLF